jgi:RNA polymerase sigma factor (TIGR02999 family)
MGDAEAAAEGAEDIVTLWQGFASGEPRARERLLALHYDEFRKVARRVLGGDGQKLQIQPTDLAHEAAIRVLKLDRLTLQDRTHFLAVSARVMRQVLLDEVRRARASKRTPPVQTQWFDPEGAPVQTRLDIEAFDDALKRLMDVDEERGRVVELRFYAGLTLEEIAAQSGESLSTVKRRWRVARAWLVQDLGIEAGD